MKQQLWILNSALLGIFFATLTLLNFFYKELPVLNIQKVSAASTDEKKPESATPAVGVFDKIFQNDLFDTYVPAEIKAVKQSLVTPMPEPKINTVTPPPEPPKQDFVVPLNINVKGIIASSDESKNVAMITDETNKEELYHLGDKIKDAEIVKIAKDRVVLLRANGQLEIFALRKNDTLDPATNDKWKAIIRKVDDQVFEVDPFEFVKEIDSLGVFLERASIIGTAFADGQPTGIKIGTITPGDLGEILGLAQDDILVSVNGINCVELKNRIQIYDTVVATKLGNSVNVNLKRGDKNIDLTYKFTKLSRAKKVLPPGIKEGSQEQDLKMSRLQERDKNMRQFEKQHENKQRETIMEIRKRILENLRQRLQNRR